jgi:hypothetical protein
VTENLPCDCPLLLHSCLHTPRLLKELPWRSTWASCLLGLLSYTVLLVNLPHHYACNLPITPLPSHCYFRLCLLPPQCPWHKNDILCVTDTRKYQVTALFRLLFYLSLFQMLLVHQNKQCGVIVKHFHTGNKLPGFKPGSTT